jgi:hypothetical protein
MKVRAHPTHHDKYRPARALWGVVVGLAGVFSCVFVLALDPGESGMLRSLRLWALLIGALAFLGGTLAAIVTEIPHRLARCPSCSRLRWRSRIDRQQSYYPCRKCDVTWTCPCSLAPSH